MKLLKLSPTENQVFLVKLAALIKSELGFAGNFTSEAEIIRLADDLARKLAGEGYFVGKDHQ